VRQKVKKLVVMGGQYPQGGESNFVTGGGGLITQYAVEHWPTPILFSGFEIGEGIISGKALASTPSANPARRAYALNGFGNGRSSWDLTAVLAAVEDPNLYWDVSGDGYCEVASDGTNQWHPTPHRGHFYLIAKVPPADVAKALDDLLALPPKTP
jgi:hypothetical protein